MKTLGLRNVTSLFSWIALLAILSISFAGQTLADDAKMNDIKQEAEDLTEAIKSYSAEQRDEALREAKRAIETLDSGIESMQRKLDREWEQMDQSARQKVQASMRTLRSKRNELAEWYGGLKHSSAKAWEDVKKGFLRSYRTLGEAFEQAQNEF